MYVYLFIFFGKDAFFCIMFVCFLYIFCIFSVYIIIFSVYFSIFSVYSSIFSVTVLYLQVVWQVYTHIYYCISWFGSHDSELLSIFFCILIPFIICIAYFLYTVTTVTAYLQRIYLPFIFRIFLYILVLEYLQKINARIAIRLLTWSNENGPGPEARATRHWHCSAPAKSTGKN